MTQNPEILTDEEIDFMEKITLGDSAFPPEYRTGVDHTAQILKLVATIRALKKELAELKKEIEELKQLVAFYKKPEKQRQYEEAMSRF